MKVLSNKRQKLKGEKDMLMRASDISKGNQEQGQVEVATLANFPTGSKQGASSQQSTRVLPTILEKGNVKMALVAHSIYWISYN